MLYFFPPLLMCNVLESLPSPPYSLAVLGISAGPGSGLLATVKYYRDQARGVTPTVSREYQVQCSTLQYSTVQYILLADQVAQSDAVRHPRRGHHLLQGDTLTITHVYKPVKSL